MRLPTPATLPFATTDALAAVTPAAARRRDPHATRVAFSGSPAGRAYRTFTIQDQEALTEHEHIWRDRCMPWETRVFTSMLYRNNVAPEQVLFDAWCADYQDELAHIAIAEAVSQYWFSGHFRQVFSTPMHYPALTLAPTCGANRAS